MAFRRKKFDNCNEDQKVDEVDVSKHARIRCQQRGIRELDIEVIYKYADICIPRRNGAELIQISNKKLREIRAHGGEGVTVDHLRNIGLIINDNDYVITVMHLKKGRYRKKIKVWKHTTCH